MIHGYCINCWWYKAQQGRHYIVTTSGLREKYGHGRCYMHNGDEEKFMEIEGDSYCPDYINRKRGDREQKMTLDQWLNK